MRIVFCLHFSRGVHDYRPKSADIPPTPDCAHEKVGSFRAKVHDFFSTKDNAPQLLGKPPYLLLAAREKQALC